MPFSILGGGLTLFAAIICIFNKYCCRGLSNPGGLMFWGLAACAWAVPETASYGLVVYAYHMFFISMFEPNTVYIYFLLFACVCHMCNNLVTAYWPLFRVMFLDDRYRRWRRSANCCQYLLLTFTHMATYLNFKFQHLQWSNIRGSPKL